MFRAKPVKITPIRFTDADLRIIQELRYKLRGCSLASTVRFALYEAHGMHCKREEVTEAPNRKRK